MPISGALSRGAVNNASGVKTTFGGVYTGKLTIPVSWISARPSGTSDERLFSILLGIIVIIALQFFTPYLVYIPKASLAAVIIAAVVFMVELHVVKPMWRTKSMHFHYVFVFNNARLTACFSFVSFPPGRPPVEIDLIPAFATFVCSLLIRLEVGIVVGIAINVIILLYTSARPRVHVETRRARAAVAYGAPPAQ